MYFLFCGVSNSMLVAPPAPTSLWMLFMSLFLGQGGAHNIPLGLLQEEGWSLWVCWKSVCSVPAGSVCGNQRPQELQEGEEEAWGLAEHFGVSLRVVVNVCTHSLFSSVWMICYSWSLFLTGAEVQGIFLRGAGPLRPRTRDIPGNRIDACHCALRMNTKGEPNTISIIRRHTDLVACERNG